MSYEALPTDTEYIMNMNNMVTDKDKDKELVSFKKIDRGYNKIYRNLPRSSDGKNIKTKIDTYTSGSTGSMIRNAETGAYYNYYVGSKDEDIFFKVSLATGECNSKNGSNTLFYISPQHYMSHMNTELSVSVINSWEEKRNSRIKASKR